MKIIPPIIASDSGDIVSFNSIEEAESYLEIYDIDAYVVYDSQGLLLKLVPKEDPASHIITRVSICSSDDMSFHEKGLIDEIISFLKRTRFPQKDWSSLSFDQLVSIIVSATERK